MKEFSIISVSIINLIIGLRYCILIYRKKIKPALAMWVFFSIAVGMSLITYMSEGDFSLADNILNSTDLLLVTTVAVFIYFFGDQSSRFTPFDKGCLFGVIAITAFWLITKTHVTTHIMIQGIMVISYLPVIKRLWNSKENTEPYSVWILLMVAPVFSLLSSKGALATIYSVRAILSTGILLLLMLKVDYYNTNLAKDNRRIFRLRNNPFRNKKIA
ncbi:MAG: hypothetical protein V2I54_11950 [Bacteroidales bacterium]|jgi:hypothetical protein|nr:hypothetical protein [Bacteroidales bacterium]